MPYNMHFLVTQESPELEEIVHQVGFRRINSVLKNEDIQIAFNSNPELKKMWPKAVSIVHLNDFSDYAELVPSKEFVDMYFGIKEAVGEVVHVDLGSCRVIEEPKILSYIRRLYHS